MKYFKCLFLIIISFSIMLSSCNSYNYTASSQINTASDDCIPEMYENSYELDIEYSTEKKSCISNIEITNINSNYAQKWRALGDNYYNLILSDYTSDTKTKEELQITINNVTTIHDNMLNYIDERLKTEYERLIYVYDTGTIVPIKLSQCEYKLYRYYALEMYTFCKDMYVDCEEP